MTILDRLLSVLGLGGGPDDREASEPTVTVEHEPDASDEAAVKGVDAGAAASTAAEEAAEPEATDELDEGGVTGEAEEREATDEAAGTEDEGTADAGAGSESVETIKGIGPAYAGKLEGAGVETVADLADADADDLAERTSLSAKRVGRWIDRARERRDA